MGTLLHLSNLRNALPFNPHKLRKILTLQNQLHIVRNVNRMKSKLKCWKMFKLNWKIWRLIDFYEYLQRINGRKYATYILNFEMFYLRWMTIYDNDQKSQSRFMSYIFNGRMLIYLDHQDLVTFGINLKEDRRQILMKIQQLNGFTNQ